TYLFERGDEARPDKSKPILPGVPGALGGKLTITPVSLPRAAYQPEKREFVIAQLTAASKSAAEVAARNAALARRFAGAAFVPVRVPSPLSLVAYAATLKRAELQLTTANLENELARARHDELLAVLKAEQLEDAGKANTPEGLAAVKQAAAAQNR